MINPSRLKKAFQEGKLKIKSVSPSGEIHWKRITAVHRHEIPWEPVFEGQTEAGFFTLSGNHRVFLSPTQKNEMENIQPGDSLLSIGNETATTIRLKSKKRVESRQYMYDLTAEDWHNFILHNSKVVISNSPDKFYHFRPPEHEGRIGNYDRVFGQIWEDAELKLYLEKALHWWNMHPPNTSLICTLDQLLADPFTASWQTAIYWYAMALALNAVSINWIADEFDYSIGGISLSIEKSAKYESLKQNAEGQFEKATEAKVRTVKFMRGLQQPRFGIGIRSAFGPHVARGVLSPRAFI